MRRRLFAGGLVLVACLMVALGTWQLQRLFWKLNLIRQVETCIHAEPQELDDWSHIGRDSAYLRVRVRGVFLHDRPTLVQALTERGAGRWIITPLRTTQGIILVNRGFVPAEHADKIGANDGVVAVTGLVRLSEPGGGFLRPNDLAADRWFSRDVAAIARKRGLSGVAPFFIDAEADPMRAGYPIGGLTVVKFRNPHLIYALTWFSLAGLCLFGLFLVCRTDTITAH